MLCNNKTRCSVKTNYVLLVQLCAARIVVSRCRAVPTAFGRCVILTWAAMQLHMYVKQCRERTQVGWDWGRIGEKQHYQRSACPSCELNVHRHCTQ